MYKKHRYKPAMLVDSHCHLNYPEFEDIEAVIARANEAGISLMQTISCKRSDFAEVKALTKNERIYGSIGVHPHEAEHHTDLTVDELVEEATHPKIIGIGETGLDYFYEHSPRDLQKESFLKHIEAARILDLPLIIHTRDADEDMAEILQNEMAKKQFKFLLHCFSSGLQLAEKALEIGGCISLSGIITFNKADELREIAKYVPLDRLLVETDAPYLAPVPHRGKKNEPAFTRNTAEKLAEIKGVSLEEIAKTTTDNFFRLFDKVAV